MPTRKKAKAAAARVKAAAASKPNKKADVAASPLRRGRSATTAAIATVADAVENNVNTGAQDEEVEDGEVENGEGDMQSDIDAENSESERRESSPVTARVSPATQAALKAACKGGGRREKNISAREKDVNFHKKKEEARDKEDKHEDNEPRTPVKSARTPRTADMYARCMDGAQYIYAHPREEEVVTGMLFCAAWVFSAAHMQEAEERADWGDFANASRKLVFPAVYPDNKDILKGIIQMGFALHASYKAIMAVKPANLRGNEQGHMNRMNAFHKEFTSFKQRCHGNLFCALTHKYVVADRPPTGCGWNAHPVVFGPLNDFPAALFYKFMQRLNRVLNADNFGQLDKDGPQQLISDGDQSGDAAWEDDGTGGQVSPSSSTNEEGLVEEASTFVLGTVSDEQKVHYRAHTHSTRTHTHCRTHTHTRIYTLTLQ